MQNVAEDSGCTVVASCSDTGTREPNFDRTVSHVSVDNDAWVIAVAAGVGNCAQPAQAAETAITTVPTQISSRREMYAALASAHDAVVGLGPPWSLGDELSIADFPAISLCIAAWSPLGGLIVGWAGDIVAIAVWHDENQSLQSIEIGQPHRRPDGALTKVLGLHTPVRMLSDGIESLADVVTDKELDSPSSGYSIALLDVDTRQLLTSSWSETPQAEPSECPTIAIAGDGVGQAEDATALMRSILDRARQTDDSDTVSAAVCRITAESQRRRHKLFARSNYDEHEVFDTPPADTMLWRYMDFPKFVSILDKSALYFTRLDLMDDPFEGMRSSFNREVRPIIYGEEISDLVLRDLDTASRRERQSTYINCWSHGEYESDALWTRYSSRENGVAIRTTCAGLIAALTCDVTCYVGSMNYVDFNTTFIPENNLFWPIVYKRKEFEYEREVRVVQKRGGFGVPHDLSADEPPGIGVYQQVDLSLLIDEVRVAPDAQSWFLELVRASCLRHGLDAPVTMSSLAEMPDL